MTEAVSTESAYRELTITREGAAGRIVLNRPRALNALNDAMRAEITAAIPGFARDPNIYALTIKSAVPGVFSVGGDLRELSTAARERSEDARKYLAADYRLNWLLECFSKPTISLMNGLAMGSGVGLTMYGTHRVAGEDYKFAMPETGVGFFPDVGLAWVFARMPGHVGMYLGLTGRQIGRADAYRLGIVTHCIRATQFEEIEAGLQAADPVDPLLDDRHEDPGRGELEPYSEVIERCFSADTVEEIFERLEQAARGGGTEGAWCADVLATLKKRSPTALKVTHRHIREAAFRDLRQTLMLDYRLACRAIETHDFHEGVRALLIDKDKNPQWRPTHVKDVTDTMLDRFFAFRPGQELILPTRQEMQAARV
ncbi:MAG: enoyl-CoA hydratase/isomerase family protein [Proteobacteria bacterium]|jgi:Enoyl-CoA hydratase/carnithine racemase|nr:MAG: enoyl-CoA hydratase/isomerase family protein [Pseudomonadota bacterium]